MTQDTATTRERWLRGGLDAMRPRFVAIGSPLPDNVHVSVGFPSTKALSRTRRTIGECWRKEASADGNCHIFLSPVLATPVELLDVLAHELVHVVTPGAKHAGQFIRVSRALGLTKGKPTQAAAGPELLDVLAEVAKNLGALPHAPILPLERMRPPQSTRLFKVACAECGYTARITRKWIEIGTPTCPCGSEMLLAV